MITTTLKNRGKALGGTAAVMGLLTVTACGGSSVEAYCDVWEDGQEQFEEFESADMGEIGTIFSDMESMLDEAVDAAPDEIEAETASMRDAIASINNASIDLDDPESWMDPEAMEELEQLEQDVATVESDAEAVEEYVDENCENVDLS